MIKTMLYGANGKMGQVVQHLAKDHETIELVAGIDRNPIKRANDFPVYQSPEEFEGKVDLIIDFSHPTYLEGMLEFVKKNQIPVVIATTGYTEGQLQKIQQLSEEVPVLYSSNMSLGINIVNKMLNQFTKVLNANFDIEVIEKHHNKKLDAPSGTALMLANTMNTVLNQSQEFTYGRQGEQKRQESEIGIHAVRGGTIVGEHTVLFAGTDELIEIKHTALSKDIFGLGAIKAGIFLINQKPGYYQLDDLFEL